MFSSTTVVGATFVVQAIGAILLAIVLLGFYRHYRRGFLIHWALSWFALCAYLLGWVARYFLAPYFGAWHPLRLGVSSLTIAAGYLQVVWLILGAYELSIGKPVSRRSSRFVVAGLLVAGIASTIVPLISGAPGLNLVRLGLRSLVLGVASLAAGYVVLRLRTAGTELGRRLVGAAFLLYAIEHFLYLGMGFSRGTYIVYLGLFGFILQSVMGLGMVVWLLEEERERVVRASEQVEHLAYHDPLTSLPNRQLFMDRLHAAIEQARRTGQKVAILYLDLDRFKVINDSLGHSCGDQLLRKAGERLNRTVRETDTVSRRGGDEYTLLLTGIDCEDEVREVAHRVMDAIRMPFNIDNQEFYVTTSMGISLFPDDGKDPETLVKNSDIAMYRAKEQGRDNYKFYSPTMNACSVERLELENSLRRGMINNEFVTHYQPIVNMETGEIEAVEALLRWQHPELGLLLPRDFLHVAEALGMMDALSHWVLRESCMKVRDWQLLGARDLKVAVNLSARPFQDPGLVSRITKLLEETGLGSEDLELEITENVAMQDGETSLNVLTELKRLGVRISIDDFGTGYSSLSYLRNFPIDTLKIDRSFVRDLTVDPDAASISAAVIALAHSLRIDVVAEGVETEQQRFLLRSQNCDHMQGHLFSEAVSAAECELLIFEHRLRTRPLDLTLMPDWREPAWESLGVASD
jgi:diguanylate cyclase (GGDEF)-like protein